jgi:hypothetical protein
MILLYRAQAIKFGGNAPFEPLANRRVEGDAIRACVTADRFRGRGSSRRGWNVGAGVSGRVSRAGDKGAKHRHRDYSDPTGWPSSCRWPCYRRHGRSEGAGRRRGWCLPRRNGSPCWVGLKIDKEAPADLDVHLVWSNYGTKKTEPSPGGSLHIPAFTRSTLRPTPLAQAARRTLVRLHNQRPAPRRRPQ